MKATVMRSVVGLFIAAIALPQPVLAHQGHAGGHGWLAGALQPLLGVDHFLAAVFVAVALSAGLGAVVRARRAGRGVKAAE